MAIPVSIISGFFIMYVAGFSINILTLVAIILAVGLVCDDAIVVLENIYAKIEEGMPPLQAAFAGSREIYFAVISTTITLAAVFLPVMFLQGLIGRLFVEFGVVLAGTILVSAFVALTLSPMMGAYLLKHQTKPNWFYRVTEPFFVWLTEGYKNSLVNFMQNRWVVFPLMIGIFYLVYVVYPLVPSELAPLEDRSNVRINASAPEGASFEYMQNALDRTAQYVLDSVPEYFAVIQVVAPSFAGAGAVNSGFVNIYLKEPEERKASQQQVFGKLSKAVTGFSDIRAFVSQPPTIGSRFSGLPVQYVLLAPTFDSLKSALPKFLEKARQSKSMQFVDADIKFNKPEIRLTIDREKAGQLGISVAEVARTLQLAYSGQRLGYYVKEGKQYQIIAQVQREDRDEPLDFKSIYLRSQAGKLVQLDNLVKMEEESNPAALYRFNRFVSATISAAPKAGFTLGQCLQELEEIKKQTLSNSFSTALAGQARDFADSSSSLLYAFVFALVLIYLVLAGQFESFIDPFIILFTVPLAVTGALISLWYFHQSMNVFSQIGIIMLIGLITKNGILIVEFANQQKEQGLPKFQAVIEASVLRLRPILMTSLATILGILPIALALGEASGSRQSLGIALVGGLVFSGILTLYIIPAIYSYMSSGKVHKVVEEVKTKEQEVLHI
jgi:multidrug efflux pump